MHTSRTASMRHRIRRRSSEFIPMNEIGRLAASVPVDRPGSAERLLMLRLYAAWGRAVGSQLAAVSRPERVRGGRLVVRVRDAAWKRELERHGSDILGRLAGLLPEASLGGLSFRLAFGEEPAAPTSAGNPSDQIRGAVSAGAGATGGIDGLQAELQSVGDADLRRRLGGVIGRYPGMAR